MHHPTDRITHTTAFVTPVVEHWLEREIVNNTDNYRGITLVSCLGKLFTCILNKILIYFDAKNNAISDAQFGFRKNMSTVDVIFTLQYLIHRTLKNINRLYCCFVDYI